MTEHPHPPADNHADDHAGERTPPQPAAPPAASTTSAPTCPWCRSADVEPLALFGSQLMTQQYYCHACHTPFERLKDDH